MTSPSKLPIIKSFFMEKQPSKQSKKKAQSTPTLTIRVKINEDVLSTMSISKHYHDFNRCNFAYALCISTFDNDSFQHFESTKSAKREDFYFILQMSIFLTENRMYPNYMKRLIKCLTYIFFFLIKNTPYDMLNMFIICLHVVGQG